MLATTILLTHSFGQLPFIPTIEVRNFDSTKLPSIMSARGGYSGDCFLSEDGKALFHGFGGWRRIDLTDFKTTGYEVFFFSTDLKGSPRVITTSQGAHITPGSHGSRKPLRYSAERLVYAPSWSQLVHVGVNRERLYVSLINLDARGETPNSMRSAPVPKMNKSHYLHIVGSHANSNGDISVWVLQMVGVDEKTLKQLPGSIALEYRISGSKFEKVELRKRIVMDAETVGFIISAKTGMIYKHDETTFFFKKLGEKRFNSVKMPQAYGRFIETGGRIYYAFDHRSPSATVGSPQLGGFPKSALWQFTGSGWKSLGNYRIVATSGSGEWMMAQVGYQGSFWLIRFGSVRRASLPG